MHSTDQDILITVLGGTFILLFFALTIIFLIMVYRKKQREYAEHQAQMEANFRKELLQAQLEMQEQTFQTLSQELHDNIGQVLSLAKLNVSLIDSRQAPQYTGNIEQTKILLNNAINDLRDISKTLNTNYIKEKDLAESIRRELIMLEHVRKFETSFANEGIPFEMPPDMRLILFRIIQECCNNVVKHAHASHLSIAMRSSANELIIDIKDNGKGFGKDIEKGVGMYNMENRMKMIKGKIEISSSAGKGTHIRLSVNKEP